MSERVERALLAAILVGFAALALGYSIVVPPFEASDELWHYPMVKTIADNWRLPVQDPANVGPWRQEGSQPPLYYVIGALATAWIDTSDIDQVRHLNAHVDNGVATPDGNINLVVHDTTRESFPWRGAVLAVHVVRLLSVAMSTAAVYLTWHIVRAAVPGRRSLALAAAGIHAFTPMYVFISGAINNDNLVVPLSSLALLMLIRLVQEEDPDTEPGRGSCATGAGPEAGPDFTGLRSILGRVPIQDYALLGVVLGLAALTKTSSLALTVLTAIVAIVRAVRRKMWVDFIAGGLATLGPVLLISGWWYVRNLRLYGDLSGLNTFIEILGKRDVPADLGQLWRERFSFAAGYWGNFGGLNVPLPGWSYRALNWLTVLAGGGLLVAAVRWLIGRARVKAGRAAPHRWPGPLGTWPFALCLLWGIGVVIPWSQWATTTWSSQGRLIFAAMPVWSMLLAMGFSAWLSPRLARGALACFVLFLLALAAAAPFLWIRPAYATPERLSDADLASMPNPLLVDFMLRGAEAGDRQPVMRLLGYGVDAQQVAPGEPLAVTLYWEALAPTARDSTVFVHLLGEGQLLVTQRDTYPGLGLLSTTRLEPGFRWADRYVLQVPDTAFTPDAAQIELGINETERGTRLQAVGSDGQGLGDHVLFARVDVRPPASDIPNPISVSFGDRMALVGYDLSRRIAAPGDEIALTLYWEARRPTRVEYTVSAQLVDERQRKAAQVDKWPQAGSAPTSSWQPGQSIVDVIPLTISGEAESGAYDVRVAVYWLDEGEIRHLPVVPPGGRMLADHIVLTQVRIVPR